MNKKLFLLAVILIALLVSSPAFAQKCEMMKMGESSGEGIHKMCGKMDNLWIEKEVKRGGMGSGMMMGCCKKEFFLCCKEKLELTDEQVKSLKSIKMDFIKADIQKEADLKIAELELKELMAADKMDMAKVEKMIKDIHMMKAEKKIAHLKAFEKAKSILTPEQLKKQKEQHEMMMKGM